MFEKNDLFTQKRLHYAATALTAVSVAAGLASVLVTVGLIGRLWAGARLGELLLLGTAVCLCQAVKAAFLAAALKVAHDFAFTSLLDIRFRLVGHLQRLPLPFFQKHKTGEIANIVDKDVERIELYLAHTLPDVMVTNVACVAIVAALCAVDWRLGLAAVCTVPVVFILLPLFGRLWRQTIGAYQGSLAKVGGEIMEYIAAMPLIKAFSTEEHKTEQVLRGLRAHIGHARWAIIVQAVPMSITSLLMEGGVVAVAIVGACILIGQPPGGQDIATFILGIILAGQFAKTFAKIMSLNYNKIVYQTTKKTLDSLLAEPTLPEKPDSGMPSGDIVLKGVGYAYSPGRPALNSVSVTFAQGTVNAVVGPSGAGKSTLAMMIAGMLSPEEGSISIGGRNLAKVSENDLAAAVAYVQQDVFLFDASIADNIRIGKPDASIEEVMAAAVGAQVHNEVMALPQGYDTLTGEGGARLSGGQRQRIALARMMLKDAPIVILDEATAAVDPYGEAQIQQALATLCAGKTLVVIAHRLRTVEGASQILVLQDGAVAACGQHEDLLQDCKLYRELYAAERQAEAWAMGNNAEPRQVGHVA
jgi:ATP-binding cassette subfamily B protein